MARRMLTLYDKFLIIGLLAAALLVLIFVRYTARETSIVVALVDGKEVFRASLMEDQRFSVDGPLGKTDIQIKDKRVRVVDSPCNKKICVHTGWIDRSYQTIICAPNHVVIRLLRGDDKDKLDAVTG
jgi:hypothetical protein